jgi:hypothetical protein
MKGGRASGETQDRPLGIKPCQHHPGVKQPGREADHSPPSSAEVKNTWIYTTTPLYVFMA